MFSKPKCGWTEVKIGEYELGSASYIYEVITPTLSTLYNYLSKPVYENSALNLIYDAEGHSFGIVQIGDDFYSWNDDNDEGQVELQECLNMDDRDSYNWVRTLADEIIDDVESNWDDWIAFECILNDEDMDEYDRETYKATEYKIAELIENIKSLRPQRMPELGNLLFGHSYGEYPIEDREKFQEKFWELLEMGFDSYGYIDNDKLEKYAQIKESNLTNRDIYPEDSRPVKENPDYKPRLHYFDNGVFMINPYYWGDAEDLMDFPNFIYYGVTAEENVEFRWYKYPWRDSYVSKNISYKDFCKIVDKCKDSLKGEIDRRK